MSFFTDLLARRHQQALNQPTLLQQTQQDPAQPVLPNSQQQSPLYNTEKFYSITPTAPAEQPKVDTSNAIGSLAQLLGPTPAEREAQQARLERNRQQMAMWTGLFDGLRQLSNLYYTAKGARPQQYSDPYKTIDENYNREVKRLDDLAQYRRAYAKTLYDLQRQAGIDEQNRALNEAKIDWYKNRDEQNAEKVALQRFRADTDRMYKTATLEQKKRMNDIMADYYSGRRSLMEAQEELIKIKAANGGFASGGRNGGVGEYEVIETQGIDDEGNQYKRKRRVRIDSSGEPKVTDKTVVKTKKENPKKANEKNPEKKQTSEKRKSRRQL